MTAQIHHFPRPLADDGLTAALDVSHRVFSGERVGLADMIDARNTIAARTNAKTTVALLGTYIDARRDEIRTEAKQRGTIRAALVDCAGLAVIIAAVVAVYLAGP